jgi:arsenite-transporting ATPase
VAEELSVLPGMEEASAFLWLEKFYREDDYDLIVIDSAPTGETLTLLSLPQVTQSWLTKAFPGQKLAVKTLGSVVRRTTGVPLDKGYEELQKLFDKLESIQQVFLDPAVCSIRIVANPERMVIQEAKRAYTYLQLYGYNVDAIIVNRIFPDSLSDNAVFSKYVQSQTKYLTEIEESFSNLPIFKVEHLGEEVFGMDLLEGIGDAIYGDENPATIFYQEKPFLIEQADDFFKVKIKLPFIGKDDFKLDKYGDELIINIANRRKSIILPRFANFLQLYSYAYTEPWLTILLRKGEE